jgi:spermidine dehydrogenase
LRYNSVVEMAKRKTKQRGDNSLGMNAPITRRDFLGSTLLASGAMLLDGLTPRELLAETDDFTGYGGVGEYSSSNGNTWPVLQAGHKIRDAVYNKLPKDIADTGETFDCVIVGGGISGLAAALFYQRKAGANGKCLVLENHPIFGGEAKQNEFLVDGKRLIAHQGSAIYQLQQPQSFLARFYDSIGLKTPKLTYQRWGGSLPEMPLSRTPYDAIGLDAGQYAFWFSARFGTAKPGIWVMDPVRTRLRDAPINNTAREEWMRFLSGKELTGKPFEHPKFEGDAVSRYLDTITLENHYCVRFGMNRETVRAFLSPVEGGGSGLGPDALSAYCDYAFEMLQPVADESGEMDQMFPGGNATIARLMVKTLIPASIDGEASVENVCRNMVNFAALDAAGAPARIRLGSTVVAVQHDGDPAKASNVSVVYEKDGKLYRVKARSVVMAGGSWTSKHIVRDLPETHRQAYSQFYRSPCMMANVAVRNWRFLHKMGLTGCRWFGGGVGNYFEVRKLALTGLEDPAIGPDSPVVLSLKVLYSYPGFPTEDQGNRGRNELLGTPFREYERGIRQQFTDMFAKAGFDAERDIAGIVLNRWGHAYLSPQPGFFFGKDGKPAPREVLRQAPFGRIAFANTDLAGAMDHRFSILEAQRAMHQLFS